MNNLKASFVSFFKKDTYRSILFFLLIYLAIFSVHALRPEVGIESDSPSYIQSIQVLKTSVVPADFLANRIVTTYLGLRSVMVIDFLVHDIELSWLIMNSIFYIICGMFFYALLTRIVENSKVAFWGALLFVLNYGMVAFGLSYMMDIGGWTFYIISLYYSYSYLESGNTKWLWTASLLTGVGGLFKEYSFLAYVVIFGSILFLAGREWRKSIQPVFISGLITFVPVVLLNVYAYLTFDYTYFSWFFNQPEYVYSSRILEYIKAFGSLYNFGWFLFLAGGYILLKRTKEVFIDKKIFFIWLVLLSSTAVFVWPIVTRVLFITLPGVVMVSSLVLKKIEKKWYFLVPLLILYIISSYLMNPYILNFVNI